MLHKNNKCLILIPVQEKNKNHFTCKKIIKICKSNSKIKILNKRRKWDKIIKRVGYKKPSKIYRQKKNKKFRLWFKKTLIGINLHR